MTGFPTTRVEAVLARDAGRLAYIVYFNSTATMDLAKVAESTDLPMKDALARLIDKTLREAAEEAST